MPRTLKHEYIGISLLFFLLSASGARGFPLGKNFPLPSSKSISEIHDKILEHFRIVGYGNSLSSSSEFSSDNADNCGHLFRFRGETDSDLALLHCEGNARKIRILQGEELLLKQSTAPTIGGDGRVYACIGNHASAFNMDSTLAWTVGLNDTCEHLLSPAVTNDGKVYVAANGRVVVISYSENLDLLSVWDLYKSTSLDGSMLGSKHIMGLTLMANGTSILINAGIAGLYAVTKNGSPLWSTRGDFHSKDVTFPPGTFCSEQDEICYFHFSPAVDHCDGSIYLSDMADSTYEWVALCDRWMESLCKVAL